MESVHEFYNRVRSWLTERLDSNGPHRGQRARSGNAIEIQRIALEVDAAYLSSAV
jgi:hypothetical protein